MAAVIGISSTVTPTSQSSAVVSAGILITCLVCWMILRESERLLGVLGINGTNALTKFMGLLLLCIGVQLAVTGIEAILQ
jgi:multiple antibiotic resistance protein